MRGNVFFPKLKKTPNHPQTYTLFIEAALQTSTEEIFVLVILMKWSMLYRKQAVISNGSLDYNFLCKLSYALSSVF